MGFVVEGRDWSDGDEEGESTYSAFVFESNTEGEKVDTPLLFRRMFCSEEKLCEN